MSNLLKDGNRVTVAGGVSNADATVVLPFKIDSVTGRVLIDITAGLSGTKVYYVSDSSGGAVTRKLTFTNGILTSET